MVGTMMALIPDALYANWRCDEQYQVFQAAVAAQGGPAEAAAVSWHPYFTSFAFLAGCAQELWCEGARHRLQRCVCARHLT